MGNNNNFKKSHLNSQVGGYALIALEIMNTNLGLNNNNLIVVM